MQIQIDNKNFMDLPEVSEKIGIGLYTLRLYVREGKLKATKVGKKYWVEESNLKEIFERGISEPVKDTKKNRG